MKEETVYVYTSQIVIIRLSLRRSNPVKFKQGYNCFAIKSCQNPKFNDWTKDFAMKGKPSETSVALHAQLLPVPQTA